jgi:hypothetical protein
VDFHIRSALGRRVVEGRKFLIRPQSRAGFCHALGQDRFDSEIFVGLVRYEATITPPSGGRYADEGEAPLHLIGVHAKSPFVAGAKTTTGILLESFRSELFSARPVGCPDDEDEDDDDCPDEDSDGDGEDDDDDDD